MKYLTEQRLCRALRKIFPTGHVSHEADIIRHPTLSRRFKPDYIVRVNAHNLVVEFDEVFHFTRMDNVVRDMQAQYAYLKAGYSVVRIPYFIQLDPHVSEALFGWHTEAQPGDYSYGFPHGFVDMGAKRPIAFNIYGLGAYGYYIDALNTISPGLRLDPVELAFAHTAPFGRLEREGITCTKEDFPELLHTAKQAYTKLCAQHGHAPYAPLLSVDVAASFQ